jgi:hypothetical protein
MLEAASQTLEMPKDELVQELKDGNSLAEVAEAQGMSVGTFTEALLSQVRVQLDELVAEGKLTQEQADNIFQRTEENIDRIVSGQPGPGGPGGPRRGPGGFDGPPPDGAPESVSP